MIESFAKKECVPLLWVWSFLIDPWIYMHQYMYVNIYIYVYPVHTHIYIYT